MVTNYPRIRAEYNYWLYVSGPAALTGGARFDQCPAPFAGRSGSTHLHNAAATPRKPLLTPGLGSLS
jgi:hypothetical protein